MINLRLTRWATYLVPGSIVVLALALLLDRFLPRLASVIDSLCLSAGVELFLAAVSAYVAGIGLWGVGYFRPVQKWVFRDPHMPRTTGRCRVMPQAKP